MLLRTALIAALAAPLLVLPAGAQQNDAAFGERVRAYLLENPEVLVEAMDVLETRRRAEAVAAERALIRANARALFDDGMSLVAGDPDGDVTVVEFLDYNCGYCKRAHADVQALVRMNPNLRYVVKEFPILAPSSQTAAYAALASLRQDPSGELYQEFNNLLMGHRGQLDDATVFRLAEDAGLDAARLRRDMDDPDIAATVRETRRLAETLQITGTPTFVVGEQVVRGAVGLQRLQEAVDTAREEG